MTDTLFASLCACFALPPDSPEAAALLIPAYQSPEPAPQPPHTRDVIYYYAHPEDDPSARYQTQTPDARPAVSSPILYRWVVICYGPRCLENALTIRASLAPDGAGTPRAILRAAGFYLHPDPPPPAVLYEEENSLWRKRADLTLRLTACHTHTSPQDRGAISSVPPIVIHHIKRK